ncbi:UDPglucose--hexose-1-phosphate uridylyltransferase [Halanaerobacter jeridensis]|uniref:Galactose-1-phosphate uridylyltransferase n=1 Tax=Halanaerobacter jeridensis TaxID=706427 RepID=A0A939BPE8_9FIRM|nr:UDPglucose--hexose-1-phosphate uridylyltransferase [Halanaerobacter jeridensis]
MSEIREDIITGDHVVISSERGKRPHDFNHEETTNKDDYCPFCYGNEDDTPPEITATSSNPNRKENEAGWDIRVIPNKFAALDIDADLKRQNGFYNKMTGVGAAEVLIESPDHEGSLGTHGLEHTIDIMRVLKERHDDLAQDERLKYVQIFKNHGGTAGASLEHPHWQIMSTPLIPTAIRGELDGAEEYYSENGNCVFCDILTEETEKGSRIIEDTEEFTAFAPYASRYPFEMWIMPKEHQHSLGQISEEQLKDLVKVLQKMIRKLEVGFDNPPYNIVLHTAPFLDGVEKKYHWHIEILPRLSINAGFELGTGNFINPTSPELAAETVEDITIE